VLKPLISDELNFRVYSGSHFNRTLTAFDKEEFDCSEKYHAAV
jgi:hypothetical protein